MGKKSHLDSLIEYIKSHKHKNDFLMVLKIIYSCSLNDLLINNASNPKTYDAFTIECVTTFYKWYISVNPNKKLYYGYDNKINALYRLAKKRLSTMSNKKTVTEKDDDLRDLGEMIGITSLALCHSYSNLLEIVGGTDIRFYDFSFLAKPIFKNVDRYPEIAFYLEFPN